MLGTTIDPTKCCEESMTEHRYICEEHLLHMESGHWRFWDFNYGSMGKNTTVSAELEKKTTF